MHKILLIFFLLMAVTKIETELVMSYCDHPGTNPATWYIMFPASRQCTESVLMEYHAAEIPLEFDGQLSDLFVVADRRGSSGGDAVAVFRNNQASILGCTLGTGKRCTDTEHRINVHKGDTFSVRLMTGAASDSVSGVRAGFYYSHKKAGK